MAEFPASYDFFTAQFEGTPAAEVLRHLLQLSGPLKAAMLPEGKLDLPSTGFTTPLDSAHWPPLGRIRLMLVNGAPSMVDSLGNVTSLVPAAAPTFYTNPHLVSVNTVVAPGTTVYIPRYLEIAAGVTLEIGADADVEVG